MQQFQDGRLSRPQSLYSSHKTLVSHIDKTKPARSEERDTQVLKLLYNEAHRSMPQMRDYHPPIKTSATDHSAK